MTKGQKELVGKATEDHLAAMINESANEIWLAGLGAFSKAQQEGAKMFEALVAEGEKVQERTKVAADERVAELRKGATGAWDDLKKVFEDRMARAAYVERSEPPRHRHPVKAGPGDHQAAVGGGRDARPWACAQGESRINPLALDVPS